jgi:hypothetical protein
MIKPMLRQDMMLFDCECGEAWNRLDPADDGELVDYEDALRHTAESVAEAVAAKDRRIAELEGALNECIRETQQPRIFNRCAVLDICKHALSPTQGTTQGTTEGGTE